MLDQWIQQLAQDDGPRKAAERYAKRRSDAELGEGGDPYYSIVGLDGLGDARPSSG